MAILLKNIKLPLTADEALLPALASRALNVPRDAIQALRVVRITTDARKKEDIVQLYTLCVTLSAADEARLRAKDPALEAAIGPYEEVDPTGVRPLDAPIVVVGMGPAGLFAAYELARKGYRPILLERGKDIARRAADVRRFTDTGVLDPQSNVMFGAGGAGTFSDGKLMTRIKDPRSARVLEIFVQNGAPEEIGVQAKPHIGTDHLRGVIDTLYKEILRMGGTVRFDACLTGLGVKDGKLRSLRVYENGTETTLPCSACILAIGQGARDTYRMLLSSGLALAPKAFAAGVRIEHPRALIDQAQFGRWAGHPRLGAAEYHLSMQHGTRGVYTFCMCPGGVVIPSASAPGEVVTNGMSNYARNGESSNAAIVVQVSPADFGAGPLDGVLFQEQLEHAAFALGGGGFAAPVCRVADLCTGKAKALGSVQPTYRPGVRVCDVAQCLPDYMAQGIKAGIAAFGRQLRGFSMPDAVVTAVESRTSAPVRILRGETLEALNCAGLYPVGEGAGYAGGIVSAAVDGMRAAEAVMGVYKA